MPYIKYTWNYSDVKCPCCKTVHENDNLLTISRINMEHAFAKLSSDKFIKLVNRYDSSIIVYLDDRDKQEQTKFEEETKSLVDIEIIPDEVGHKLFHTAMNSEDGVAYYNG